MTGNDAPTTEEPPADGERDEERGRADCPALLDATRPGIARRATDRTSVLPSTKRNRRPSDARAMVTTAPNRGPSGRPSAPDQRDGSPSARALRGSGSGSGSESGSDPKPSAAAHAPTPWSGFGRSTTGPGLEAGFGTDGALVTLPGERPFDMASARREGKYLLAEVIGEGGMGRVFSTREVELGRTVALKTIRPELADNEAFVRALVFEARLTGQLEHPNIVPVHELGTMDGLPFYTMKLVGDLSLKDVLRQQRAGSTFAGRHYSLRRMLQYLRGICMAVEFAHARGVVHRDLKPDNVLIGDYGEVQIMDWGVARVMPHGGQPAYFAGSVEQPGAIIGTPHYMSPEQARGETALVDARSDVYGIGVILYEILTLRLPYEAADISGQMDALLGATPPVDPQLRAPDRDIPRPLADIAMKAISRRRRDRFSSARALWEAVEAYIDGERERKRLGQLAEAQVVVAEAAASRFEHVSQTLFDLEDHVRRDTLAARPFDSLTRRQEAWQRQLRAERLRLVEARAFAEAVSGYQQALAYQPGHRLARTHLGALYRQRAGQARRRGDDAGFVLYGDLERALDPSTNSPGTLNVRSYPEGARIRVFELDGPGESVLTQDVYTAPVGHISLAPGSYLVSAILPGYRENQVPVVVQPRETAHVLVVLKPWDATVPLVARGDELTAIKEAYNGCVADERLTSLMVCGGPGLGKGKLLSEFGSHLDGLPDSIHWGTVRCDILYRHVPLQAVTEFLTHRAGIARYDSPEVIYQKVADATRRAWDQDGTRQLTAAERAEVTWATRCIASLPTLCGRHGLPTASADTSPAAAANDEPDERGDDWTLQVFEAVTAYLGRLTDRAPVVLVIRGAEYLDRLSRDLLFFIAERLWDRPLFCLMLARQDSLAMRCDQTIQLLPMSPDRVRHQVQVLLRAPVTNAVVDFIMERTEGNPFQVTEFVKTMVDKEWVHFTSRQWRFTERGRGFATAEMDLDAMLRTQLDDLDPSAIEVLSAASVMGGTFWAEHVVAQLGRPVDAELQELCALHLLVPHPSSRFLATREFAFRLHGMRRLLYSDQPPDRRADHHKRIAGWLQEFAADDLPTRALLADHLARGGAKEDAAQLTRTLESVAHRWESPTAPPWADWPQNLAPGALLAVEDGVEGPPDDDNDEAP